MPRRKRSVAADSATTTKSPVDPVPPIACPVEALRRLQAEFNQLAKDGCDPEVAFITLRRRVFKGDGVEREVPYEPHHNYAERRYESEVRTHGLYARDWGWELSGRHGEPKAYRNDNKPVGETWTDQLAGWGIPDQCATMPACERWQIVFLPSHDFPRLEKLCKRAATLIGSVFESPIMQWVFGPNRPKESEVCFGVPGLWCDVVLHVALQRIPGVMVSTYAFSRDESLRQIGWMQPGDWTKPEQPPVWVAKVEHFSTASVDCIDALIANWPKQSAIAFNEVKPQAEMPPGGDDAGGGRGEADGKPATLRPCDDKAWSQYRRALEDNPELTTDQAAYDWFIEHIADEGETLPAFASWVKYVRLARAAAGEQKNKRGVGHETRSVVSPKRLDQPKRTETDQS